MAGNSNYLKIWHSVNKDKIFGLKLYFFPRFRSLCNGGENADEKKINIAVAKITASSAVAEISIKKEENNHVCNIKIKDESKPIPAKLNQAKRSLSSVSSTRPPTGMKVVCLFIKSPKAVGDF